MPIRLAMSIVACPDWPVEKVAAHAKQWGYQGLELRTLGPDGDGPALASDPTKVDADHLVKVCQDAGVIPVCLATSVALHHKDDGAGKAASWQAVRALELAAKLGCEYVRLFGTRIEPGQDRRSVLVRIAQRTAPLARRAAELGVMILFENAGSFEKSKDWWWLTDLVQHPAVGLCWNVANAAAAGESPAVSVPNLHSRIHIAKVKDTRVGEGGGFVPLGEGTVGVEAFIRRLLGVGFERWVSVEWDRLWLPKLAPAEEYLPDAARRIQGWIAAAAKAIEDARPKPKPARPAAKTAAKPQPA